MKLQSAMLVAAVLIGLGACSPTVSRQEQPGTAQAIHPVSGLKVIPLTVQRGDTLLRFQVEVAASPQEQARGLMFRTSMGVNEGMIFPMDPPRGAAFWMKNTVIPLDIIFVGIDRRVLNIAANTVPYSEEPIPSDGAAAAVLELNGGRAAQLGIVPGDRVNW